MGVLFQGGALFDSFTVEENVMFPLNMFTKMSFEEKRDRVNDVLKRVELINANNKLPSEDEPNSGLDPKTAEIIDALISELTEEFDMTTVVNTHDMNSVLQIGQKISYLHQGNLWWEGNQKEIMKTDNKELNDFVFSTELTRRLK